MSPFRCGYLEHPRNSFWGAGGKHCPSKCSLGLYYESLLTSYRHQMRVSEVQSGSRQKSVRSVAATTCRARASQRRTQSQCAIACKLQTAPDLMSVMRPQVLQCSQFLLQRFSANAAGLPAPHLCQVCHIIF